MTRPLSAAVSLHCALLALGLANARYWTTVAPQVRRELRRWRRSAHAIADPALRRHAVEKLRDEHFNAEVAATLATLAPSRRRAQVVTAIVAFQVIYDYLDAVSEQPARDPLANGRQLYRAFTAALSPTGAAPDAVGGGGGGGGGGGEDFYRHNPQRDDAGYLEALVGTCRTAFRELPRAATVAPVAQRTAIRCGEAQTRVHAVPRLGTAQLASWARHEMPDRAMAWWEVTAGAAASVLSVHALIAAAADPATRMQDAIDLEAAYLPISALTTLLDSVVDSARDTATGGHGFVAYYPDPSIAAARVAQIAQLGMGAAASLRRHASHHAMTVTGAAAYYLSAPSATTASARPVTEGTIRELRPLITPIMWLFRMWRIVKGVQPADRSSTAGRSAVLATPAINRGREGPCRRSCAP